MYFLTKIEEEEEETNDLDDERIIYCNSAGQHTNDSDIYYLEKKDDSNFYSMLPFIFIIAIFFTPSELKKKEFLYFFVQFLRFKQFSKLLEARLSVFLAIKIKTNNQTNGIRKYVFAPKFGNHKKTKNLEIYQVLRNKE